MKSVVLCGGQSTRMGTDKGLIKNGPISWAELAFNKLTELNMPVLISLNEQQYGAYNGIFQSSVLVPDVETLQVVGPLKGILSVHLQEREEDLLVLACDLPYMHTEVLSNLHTSWGKLCPEAMVYKGEEGLEPLVGIYSSAGLQKIYTLYRNAELVKFSLYHVLSLLDSYYLPLPEFWSGYVKNINTPGNMETK